MNNTWVKLHRNIVDWEWFDDKNALKLLIYLNVKVNIVDKQWKGITVKRGSLVTGKYSITEDLGISVQQYRTALKKLVQSGEIVKKATNAYTILTLTKWEKMQHEQQTDNKRITNEQQTDNKRIYPTKESKESKESKEREEKRLSDFDIFWKTYAKPEGKKKASDKFLRLPQKDVDKILLVVKNYVSSTPDKKYRKHPTTWLNGEHWNDEITEVKKTGINRQLKANGNLRMS
jgi:hypothetical protein